MKPHDDTYKRIDSLVHLKLQDDVLHAFAAMMNDLLDMERQRDYDAAQAENVEGRQNEAAPRY